MGLACIFSSFANDYITYLLNEKKGGFRHPFILFIPVHQVPLRDHPVLAMSVTAVYFPQEPGP